MGFFSYAYVIEGTEHERAVRLTITAYSTGGPALFSWGPGTRPVGLTSIADGTLFSAKPLHSLPGYPRIDERSDPSGAQLDEVYIEENFSTGHRKEPVLFHVILPPRFVIRRNRTPFTLKPEANIALKNDRLFFTWPTIGAGDLRFWIARLAATESFDQFDLGSLLTAPTNSKTKLAFELNFGIAKIKVG